MRSLRRGTIWSAGRRWLWAGSIGLAFASPAVAGDACAPGCGPDGTSACESTGCGHGGFSLKDLFGGCRGDECAAADGCGDEACGSGCTDGCCGSGYLFGGDEAWTLQSALFGDDPCDPAPFTVGGWTQFGYHSASTGLFNSHPDQLVNHQDYLYIERVADGSDGLGFGFRADIMYGADAQDTQAFGEPVPQSHWDTDWDHGAYGWALPQLYAEAAYGDLSVKVGHFYTLIGYEVVTAPDNFFYSHSFTMYNSEPFTHTGALASYAASDNTTVYGGWVAGWDTGFDRFSDGDNSKGSAAIFGVSQGLTDAITLTYIGLAGDMGVRGEGYNHSVVVDVALTDKLNYVFQTDYVDLNAVGTIDRSIGVNNFLFYTINDQLAVGGRAEWYEPSGIADGSVYQATAGVNYKPMANLVIRPEYRYQWGDPAVLGSFAGAFNNAGATGQPASEGGIFGIDAILTF